MLFRSVKGAYETCKPNSLGRKKLVMYWNTEGEAVRGAFPVKKVSSSHSKKQTVIITEQDIDEQELKAVIDGTGYESGAVKKEPYEKKGLFGFLK